MAAIDILLPVRNGMPFLPEAIDSIVGQSFADWRLLILDHGSSDGSAELAHRRADREKRIEVHSVPEASGLADLLNHGLLRCDCRLVVRQDADDVSLRDRLQLSIDRHRDDPGLLLLGGNAIVIDASGKEVGTLQFPGGAAAVTARAFFANPITHPTVAINFPSFVNLGARYGVDLVKALPSRQSIRITALAEDYFLFGQLALLGRCVNLQVPLIRYRVHTGSVSVARRREQATTALVVSRFLARSFCATTGSDPFDPTPFCTHGEQVFDCGATSYATEYGCLERALRRGLAPSAELERELAFRRIFADRRSPVMAINYARFSARHGLQPCEYRSVRNWVGKFVTEKHVYRVGGVERLSGSVGS